MASCRFLVKRKYRGTDAQFLFEQIVAQFNWKVC